MTENANILIVGVGGQGSLLASRILGEFFAARGLDVKLSEVHGMSQRGGSVVTYIRAAKNVDSPLIEPGGADIVISFELLESLRYAHFLKPGGIMLSSSQRIEPMPVITGTAKYPENIADILKENNVRSIIIDALDLSLRAGNVKSANVVMIGAASAYLGGNLEEWESALVSCIPANFLEVNLRAFTYGYNLNENNICSIKD